MNLIEQEESWSRPCWTKRSGAYSLCEYCHAHLMPMVFLKAVVRPLDHSLRELTLRTNLDSSRSISREISTLFAAFAMSSPTNQTL